MRICRQCGAELIEDDWLCITCGWEPQVVDGVKILDPHIIDQDDLGFPQEAFEKLYDLESEHFWFCARNKLIVWAMNKYFPASKTMLEIGCGTGFVSAGLKQANPQLILTGSDVSARGLSFAKQRIACLDCVQFDATDIPYREEFDVIGAFDVLEHIEDDHKVLRSIKQALKPRGGVMITIPQHQFLWSSADEKACHKRRYSKKEIIELLDKAGFEIIRATSFITLLMPFMLVSRKILNKNDKPENDPLAELKLPRVMNYTFEMICSLELLLIKSGINLPFGGSLFIIARKVK